MRDDPTGPAKTFAALRSTLALDDALARLDQAVEDQARHLATLSALSARIAALATPDGAVPPHRQGRLKTLRLRHHATEKLLDKTHRTLAEERAAYHAALTGGRDALSRHAMLLTELRSGLETRARENAALCRTLQRQFFRQCAAATASDAPGFDVPDGSYDYISIGLARFLDLLAQLDVQLAHDPAYACDGARYRPVSFLEIGCGPGHNLELARTAEICRFSACTGFDINPQAIKIGRAAFDLGDAVTAADALEYDYGAPDVIYSFRPFSNPEFQGRLETLIAQTMRPGAYLIAPASLNLEGYPALTPAGGSGDIWRKRGAEG
ncbi:class I SAM-dependent methyltransferase [Aquicoccus sp. SU-CL01552]|uniref:class I SAM-dependent methyltransferase n=1 Tax=Aquicoccus sp. SU-CL01552 TaxID=3127656 RepID=UPI003106622C